MEESLDHFIGSVVRECREPEAFIEEQAGAALGPYVLREKIGTGGFGVVWRAEQTHPVRRQVAVKIIKVGMDTREIVSRFRAERQTLAVLEHPGIAKILDAGATPAGRPYYVMELLRGLPLTAHASRHQLAPRDRLRLFVEVCRAVQHAHLKGVIHRDLKPSNVIVADVGGVPRPKVIDFGIARITDDSEAAEARTYLTREDRFVGTPSYMSPEQFQPGRDIDARSDIFSLGVVLYELVTGRLPHAVDARGLVDHSRIPVRPSAVQGAESRRAPLHWMRRTRSAGERPDLPADFDWIVLKALAEDRADRYDSADAFASDIEACLESRPVGARPPTPWYLLERFARRNRLAVAAGCAVLFTLSAGMVATTSMYLGQRRALVRSEQVARFMKDVLAQAGDSNSRGRDAAMMREILEKTASRIGSELSDYPDVQADLHGVIGRTYADIDEYELAVAQSAEQLRLRRLLHGAGDHPDLATALVDHASAVEALGKPKEAEPFIVEGIALRRRLYREDHPLVGEAHGIHAWILIKSGRAAEAEESARIAYGIWKGHPGHEALADAPKALLAFFKNTNRLPEAMEGGHEFLAEMRRLHGEMHPQVVVALDMVGYNFVLCGSFEEAEPILLECLELGRKVHRGRSPVEDHACASLARVAASRGDWDKELEYGRASFAAASRVFPPGHRYLREGSGVLARVLLGHAERFATAEPARSRERLEELRSTAGLEGDAKAHAAWISCLEALLLSTEPSSREAAREGLLAGIAGLRSKSSPSKEDLDRIKKAEGWLAEW
jgi:serine/threonine protein kinase